MKVKKAEKIASIFVVLVGVVGFSVLGYLLEVTEHHVASAATQLGMVCFVLAALFALKW